MTSSLFLDGKKYISAKEASSITGYSKDYIGQLARGKKIDSKRIGRVWYVLEEAILNYKNFLNQSGLSLETETKKIQLPELVRTYLQKPPSAGGKLILFVFSSLLMVGVFSVSGSKVSIPNLLKNVFSVPANFLPASVESITSPAISYDSLASAFKNYISPSSTINISDLATAYKNFIKTVATIQPPKSPLSGGLPNSASSSGRAPGGISDASLAAAIEKVINQPEIAAKLRGPQGPVGPQGASGLNGLNGSAGGPSSPIFIPVGQSQPNPSVNYTGGSTFNATNLSSGNFSTNNATVSGDLTVSGSSTFEAPINITGDSTLAGNLTVGGATTLNNTFSQTGANTFSTGTGAVSLNGPTSVTGTNTFTVGTGLNVTSAGALSGISTIGMSDQLTSTLATGAAPFIVASTTQVANLNAATAGTATNANNVATTATTTSASYYPLFVSSSDNGNQAPYLGTGLTFNPNTNTLTTTTFSGALTGHASSDLPLAGGTLTGNLLFSADNTLDIGANGATRPRTGYFGTSLIAPVGTFATSVTSPTVYGSAATANNLTLRSNSTDLTTGSVLFTDTKDSTTTTSGFSTPFPLLPGFPQPSSSSFPRCKRESRFSLSRLPEPYGV